MEDEYELVYGWCNECDLRKIVVGCSVGHEECLDTFGKCWKLKTKTEENETGN